MTRLPPPHNVEAERAVVASLLLRPDAVAEWPSWLGAADFFDDRHRVIAGAVRATDAAGEAVDAVTIAARLRADGTLPRAGGSAYLAELCDATPATSHVWQHARIVAGMARIRGVLALCQCVAAEGASDVGDVSAWLQSVEARVYTATQTAESEDTLTTLAEALSAERGVIAERQRSGSPLVGVTTGLKDLDKQIGGYRRGVLTVLAARPGMGKTGMALGSALACAESGLAAVVVSLEMPREQLAVRAVAQYAGLDAGRLERGDLTSDDWAKFVEAEKTLSRLPVAIDDCATQTVPSIRSAIRRAIARLRRAGHAHQLGLVVVDYLQLVDAMARGRSRENDVTEISGGLRALAKEFDCAVLALSQLNRSVESRADKRPMLSDLRESGAIEQDAFAVLFIYRDEYYRKDSPDAGKAEVIVAKLRQGGATGTTRAAFHGPSTRFADLYEPDGYEDQFTDHDDQTLHRFLD